MKAGIKMLANPDIFALHHFNPNESFESTLPTAPFSRNNILFQLSIREYKTKTTHNGATRYVGDNGGEWEVIHNYLGDDPVTTDQEKINALNQALKELNSPGRPAPEVAIHKDWGSHPRR